MVSSSPPAEVAFDLSVETAAGVSVTKSAFIQQSSGSTSDPIILPMNIRTSDFPYKIKLKGKSSTSGTILVSPLEIVVDQPLHLGCFTAQQPTTSKPDMKLTPQSCLICCQKQGMRYAGTTQ